MEFEQPHYASGLVVVPCLNEKIHIAATLRSILADPSANKLLIIVADGGSTDGTVESVRHIAAVTPNVRLLDNPARLQSAGVNLAARNFGRNRRWLIRMDAHARYPDQFVSRLMAQAERTGAASVVVAMRSEGETFFQRAAAAAQNSVLGTGGSAHRRDGAEGFVDHGHHALFDMARFLALGGYDEKQSHNEDAEFDCRLRKAGGKIWLTRQTGVTYFPRARPGALYTQYRNYGRGRAITLLRHAGRPKLRQLLPAAILPAAIAALFAPLYPWIALPLLVWLACCLAGGLFVGIGNRSFAAGASGVAAAIMHFAWSVGFWSAFAIRWDRLPKPQPLLTDGAP